MLDDWVLVVLASNDDLQSITAAAGREQDSSVIASLRFKISNILFVKIKHRTHHQIQTEWRLVAMDNNYTFDL